ncbi:MAG TPA: helix-turn-helix domain-containing protein [Streptosporangiaceae bacterium]|nr:helix-turn-helix domain-containing protein [Streptosporangiaceae bacterium]
MATTLPLIGSAEACELLGIDRSTLSRRVARGEITPAQKMPGETGPFLFQRDEIERVLADHAGQAEAASA